MEWFITVKVNSNNSIAVFKGKYHLEIYDNYNKYTDLLGFVVLTSWSLKGNIFVCTFLLSALCQKMHVKCYQV